MLFFIRMNSLARSYWSILSAVCAHDTNQWATRTPDQSQHRGGAYDMWRRRVTFTSRLRRAARDQPPWAFPEIELLHVLKHKLQSQLFKAYSLLWLNTYNVVEVKKILVTLRQQERTHSYVQKHW